MNSQNFLNELDKKLWNAADRLRANLDAAVYKHAVLGQLFTNTQTPACIWFLTKTKKKRGRGDAAFRDRTGEVLFIDARKLGYVVDRVQRAFTDEDTEKIVSTFHAWKQDKDAYEDIPGFCKSASLDEIAEHGYVLTPGRYVGAEEVEDDGVPFAEKMEGLTRELATQFLALNSR